MESGRVFLIILEAKRSEARFPVNGRSGYNRDILTGSRVPEFKFSGMKTKEVVRFSRSVLGVADNGVPCFSTMHPGLMGAPGLK